MESSAGGTSTFSLSPALGDLVLIRCMGDHISGLKRRVMTTYLMHLECRYGFISNLHKAQTTLVSSALFRAVLVVAARVMSTTMKCQTYHVYAVDIE